MKTYEYKLVVETSEEVLNQRVSDLLLGDWQLHGNFQMAFSPTAGCRFAQVVIREVERRGAWG